MQYQDIIKLFGKPLSEVARPQTINGIKLQYFVAGIGVAFIAGMILYNFTDRTEDSRNSSGPYPDR